MLEYHIDDDVSIHIYQLVYLILSSDTLHAISLASKFIVPREIIDCHFVSIKPLYDASITHWDKYELDQLLCIISRLNQLMLFLMIIYVNTT